MKNRKTVVVRNIEHGKIAYYKEKADATFWDAHWANTLKKENYQGAMAGNLGYYQEIFTKYLPAKGIILEAGCGTGHYVMALRARGYNCEGVEYAKRTVKQINLMFPNLPVKYGNVTCLDIPDNYYEGYISLGVVEHRYDGPQPFLTEAYRVLKHGGVGYISVPNISILRRVKMIMGCYCANTTGMEFYQYAYSQQEMKKYLQEAGFRILDIHFYDAWKGLKDEIALFKSCLKLPFIGYRLPRMVNRIPLFNRLFGHMSGFIVIKE